MITLVYIVAAVLSVWLAFVPLMILNELKRQGEERRSEALKIISLLVRIADSPQDKSAGAAARIQAAIDARNGKVGSE